MTNVTNQKDAIELTNSFVSSLTIETATKYLNPEEPILSLAQASIELGVFGWYYNDRQMCTDIINVAILNKLCVKS